MSHIIRLSNGIPVLFQHFEGAVAATYWWNRVGSRDEGKGEEGFAHFLEHMLFKDTAAKETGRPSSGKLAREIESMGGDINAYTSFEQTVYHVTCAEKHWERVLGVFGSMAKQGRFIKDDFDREREVILEELRRSEDNPNRQLFQELFSQVFGSHPYGRPVIGYKRTLVDARVAALDRFFKRNYRPDRMGIVLVGPIEDATGARKKKLIAQLEKCFGKKVIPLARKAEPRAAVKKSKRKGTGTVFKSIAFDVKSPTVAMAFPAPAIDHEDIPALDALSAILGTGELSRLHQKLFKQKKLVTGVHAGLYAPRDTGMFYIQADFEDMERIEQVTSEIREVLETIKKQGPEAHELERVIRQTESEKLYSTQTVDGTASRLGYLHFTVENEAFDLQYLERLRELSPDTIAKAAEKYLNFDLASIVLLRPKNLSEPKATSVIKALRGDAASRARTAKKKTPTSPTTHAELFRRESGLQVVYFPRPQSNLFSAYATSLGGLLLEGEAHAGASLLMAHTWPHGTRKKNAEEISALVEGSAARLDGVSGRNSIGLELTGLNRDFDTLSALFTEVLCEPSFADSELEHMKRVQMDAIRSVEDHSSQLCVQLFLKSLFEDHPYGRSLNGTLETVSGLSSALLLEKHHEWITLPRMTVSVAGRVSERQLEQWLSEIEGRLKTRHVSQQTSAEIPSPKPLPGPRWTERPMNREQVHVIVGGLGASLDSEDRFAIRVMQTLLGGMSGRLFIELREKRSMAYTVAPIAFEGMKTGYLGTYMACAPSKKDEALAGIRKVLEDLAKKGPTPNEMKRAKEFYLGRRAMDLQSDDAWATHLGIEALYHQRILESSEVNKRIQAVTSQQVADVVRRYLLDAPQVSSLV